MSLSYPIGFAFGAGKPDISPGGDVDGMLAVNADFVRMSLSWDDGDPNHTGKFVNTSAYDSIIAACNKAGLGVILQVALGATFGGTSSLPHLPGQGFNHNANADGSPGHNGPVNVPKLHSAFMIDVGKRYAPDSGHGTIMALELGNEPNHLKFDAGTINGIVCSGVEDAQKGVAYAEGYLQPVYSKLHAVGTTVITGGLGGISDAPGDQPADEFLTNIYAGGGGGLWDGFTFHPYCYPNSATADLAQKKGRGWWLMVNKIVPILTAQGDIAKGVWITEVGNPTNVPNIQVASANMLDIATVWGTYSWGGGGGHPLAWFTYQDGGAGASKGRLYGVLDSTGAKKQPFWKTYHDLGAGSPPPPSSGAIGLNVPAGDTGAAALMQQLWDDAGNTDDRIARVPADWSSLQAFSPLGTAGQNDTFTWTALDNVVDSYEAQGIKVCLILHVDTPGPLRPPGAQSGHVYPYRKTGDANLDAGNMAWNVVARYCGPSGRHGGGTVVAVELGNEPNNGFGITTDGSTSASKVSADAYWAFAATMALAIKLGAVDGRATRAAYGSDVVEVVSAGCGPISPGTANATDRFAAAGAAVFPYLDGIGAHLYGLQCPPTKNVSWNQRTQVLPPLRSVLDDAGYSVTGQTPIWIWINEDGCFTRLDTTPTNTGDTANCGTFGTGTGDASKEITEATAATRIGQVIDGPTSWFFANRDELGMKWWIGYELRDTDSTWSNHAGLHYQDGTAKTEPRAAFVTALGGTPTRTPPTASISTPADDPSHATGLPGDILFICPSADGDSPPTGDQPQDLTVKLYRDSGSTLVGACTWSPLSGWFYLLAQGTLTDGNYAFVTKVTNSAGQTTTSSVVHVTIDNASQTNDPPVVAIVDVVAEGVTYSTPTLHIPSDLTISVEITVSDDHDASILPDLYVDSVAADNLVAVGQPKPGAQGHYVATVDTTALTAGDHPLIATATDSGGKTGRSS